jgi:hypothetical protein
LQNERDCYEIDSVPLSVGVIAMAKKAAKATVKLERNAKPVRLDLLDQDYERLEVCARRMGVTKAAYARIAVLKQIRADEAGEK